jgi:histidine triad (HIT) family protein
MCKAFSESVYIPYFFKGFSVMGSCLFCKVIAGEILVDKVYEDENALVFKDTNPQAPSHFLAIPKKHYAAVHEIPQGETGTLIGGLMNAISEALSAAGLDKSGYRLVANFGNSAGQTVRHLHFHILGGRELRWPPG